MPRSARVRGIARVSQSTILAAGQRWVEKRLFKRCIGMKMAGRVLKVATAEKRLSRVQKMPFIPKARKTVASTTTLQRRRSIETGIPCECRSQKKWGPLAMAS